VEREPLFEIARRTFDTPEFRGIEFIESEAKSVINHVPGKYLPFKWTINPYRGCSHACSYCLAGDTQVLMGDGRTKPLGSVRIGDCIYGTERMGPYRRYVRTDVLAHWRTLKPAYRITLEDGTDVVASGDHRFLSDRGWKHVTGSEWGHGRRAHLTVNNKLMGTGRFAAQPEETADYRLGYLCGMNRGDGHLGSYSYSYDDVHRFRLALVDLEALRRARGYLADLDVRTDEFSFAEAVGQRKPLRAIRTSGRDPVRAVGEICRWPSAPTEDWTKGFLAGIFDAEGSYSCGVLRISNTNSEIIARISAGFRALGFAFKIEETSKSNGLMAVRLLGGIVQALRFFHSVDPAVTRKRSIEGAAIKNSAPLRVESIEPLGVSLPMYDITTGSGDFIANGIVSHNCFARVTHTYMDMDAGRDFETKIVVKVNAPEVLRRQLAAKRWKGEHIAMGTGTDPYQRAEGRYKLMPRIIQALTDYRNPFSILTKGTLILRDLDLLVEAARVAEVATALSIGTLDEDAWRRSEPGTPHPRKRVEAVAALNAAGVPCGVLMAPILPGITDDPAQLREVVRACIDAGATHVSPILLHLRPVVKDVFMDWLAEEYPDLLPRYQRMYARSAYAASATHNELGSKVSGIVRELGGIKPKLDAPRAGRRWSKDRARDAGGEQLSLL
jgi:DNA repair photolyase